MDNETFDDNIITQFCEVADTTPDVAKNYLSVIFKTMFYIRFIIKSIIIRIFYYIYH